MARSQTITLHQDKPKISRPNVHAKTKTSNSKNSTNYKKKYRGQGR